MIWREFISSISKDYLFKEPVMNSELTQITVELNVDLPQGLLELLKETNGVFALVLH